MITKILKSLLVLLTVSTFAFASNSPLLDPVESITFTVNAAGEIVDMPEPTTWTNGNINQFYLDDTHTQKTFNDIRLRPGTYRWKLETRKRNGRKGKVNFDITVKFQNGRNSKKVDRKLSPGRTDNGNFRIEDYKSQSGGSQAGYGKIKVHIGRAAINTSVNYKITLTRTGGGSTGSGTGTTGTSSNNCNYSNLGSKSGNVIGNTVGKYTSQKKACKNAASVRITKTGGRARTTILVYVSNTKNGSGTLKDSYEFPNGNRKGSETIRITGCNGKFVRVEVKNRSAANTFQYNLSITQ